MDRLLENDTVLKVLSVLVAVFLWIQVSSSNVHVHNRAIGPVALEWVPPAGKHLSVTSLRPNAVDVQIKGPPAAVEKVNRSQIATWVDLSHLSRAGHYTLPVVATVPTGTSIVSIKPSQVVVTLDQTISRKMAITVKPMGSVSSKYVMTHLTSSQHSATILGPSSEVRKVTAVDAEVPLGSRTSSFSEQVMLLPVNQDGTVVSHVEVNPLMTTVSATIKAKPPQKSVGVVAKLTGQPASGFVVKTISVSPNTIILTGKKSALSAVTTVPTIPINITGDRASVTQLATLKLPTGVSSTVGHVMVTIVIGP